MYLGPTLFYCVEHLCLLIEVHKYISSRNITSKTNRVAKECVLVYKFHHLELMDRVNWCILWLREQSEIPEDEEGRGMFLTQSLGSRRWLLTSYMLYIHHSSNHYIH